MQNLHRRGKPWTAHMPSVFYLVMTACFWWGLSIFAWFPPLPVCNLCSHSRAVLPSERIPLCRLQVSLQFFFCGIIQKGFPVEKTHFFFPFLLSQSYLPREAACMDLQFCLQEIGTLFHIKFMAAVRRVWDFHPTHCSTQCFVPPQFNCFLSFLSCIQSQTGFSGWGLYLHMSVTQNRWCQSSC